MILNIQSYKFDIEDEDVFSKKHTSGNILFTANPVSQRDMNYAKRWSKSIMEKAYSCAEALMGFKKIDTPDINDEFMDITKYRHGLAFIKTTGELENGLIVEGIWVGEIEEDKIKFFYDKVKENS